MKKFPYFIACTLIPTLLFSCISKPSIVSPPEWKHEKDAITLRFESVPLLNLYQEKPHSLIVCVYHLKDLNGFKQFTDENDGLAKLLECSRFDNSVTYSKRLVVQPKQELNESLDRTEGAKYVGIVAGYYSLHKVHSVRSYQIPVSIFNNPKKFTINLLMGPEGIQEVKGKR